LEECGSTEMEIGGGAVRYHKAESSSAAWISRGTHIARMKDPDFVQIAPSGGGRLSVAGDTFWTSNARPHNVTKTRTRSLHVRPVWRTAARPVSHNVWRSPPSQESDPPTLHWQDLLSSQMYKVSLGRCLDTGCLERCNLLRRYPSADENADKPC
ncbi:hypothetical protein BaRGS_00007910, partial [Batillaria attramentaria]